MITQNDLSKFKTFEDLQNQISLAELKMLDKDMEKQTIKLFENSEWLAIKPMSFLASKKYGSNTKWCTTQETNPEYFIKYTSEKVAELLATKVRETPASNIKAIVFINKSNNKTN